MPNLMSESFLIALREGFEAALVVSIVLAFVRRGPAPHLARWVWTGAGLAAAVSALAGVTIHVTVSGLTGAARMRTFAAISFVAAVLLTWMIFWMRSHGRSQRAHLEQQAASAIATTSGIGLAFVAFVAVVREGLETALFLLSTTSTSDQHDVVAGTLAGLAAASALAVALYYGVQRINMRLFFDITGGLLILFAAGLLAKSFGFLHSAGDVGTLRDAAYDVTSVHWLTFQSQVGRFLGGILGWNPRPTVEQVVVYFAYLLPVAWLYFRKPQQPARVPSEERARA